jgi:hypothetical protein
MSLRGLQSLSIHTCDAAARHGATSVGIPDRNLGGGMANLRVCSGDRWLDKRT